MLAFQLGLLFATPVLRGARFDYRFGALFGSLMVYLLFVGHRFSSFFLYFSFFIMPMGSIVLGRSKAAAFDNLAFYRMLRALWLPVACLGVLVLGLSHIPIPSCVARNRSCFRPNSPSGSWCSRARCGG
ncbi:hypothetical protein ACQ5SK_03235 [Bradyrhizobium japonicum]